MSVLLNEAALRVLLESEFGPVGRRLALRAEEVTEIASQNALGEIIGIETGALHSGIHFEIHSGAEGLEATISTNAASSWHGEAFSYPAFWDQNEKPWLSGALMTLLDRGWTVVRRGGILR